MSEFTVTLAAEPAAGLLAVAEAHPEPLAFAVHQEIAAKITEALRMGLVSVSGSFEGGPLDRLAYLTPLGRSMLRPAPASDDGREALGDDILSPTVDMGNCIHAAREFGDEVGELTRVEIEGEDNARVLLTGEEAIRFGRRLIAIGSVLAAAPSPPPVPTDEAEQWAAHIDARLDDEWAMRWDGSAASLGRIASRLPQVDDEALLDWIVTGPEGAISDVQLSEVGGAVGIKPGDWIAWFDADVHRLRPAPPAPEGEAVTLSGEEAENAAQALAQLVRIHKLGSSGIWTVDDCVVAAITGLYGEQAARDYMASHGPAPSVPSEGERAAYIWNATREDADGNVWRATDYDEGARLVEAEHVSGPDPSTGATFRLDQWAALPAPEGAAHPDPAEPKGGA